MSSPLPLRHCHVCGTKLPTAPDASYTSPAFCSLCEPNHPTSPHWQTGSERLCAICHLPLPPSTPAAPRAICQVCSGLGAVRKRAYAHDVFPRPTKHVRLIPEPPVVEPTSVHQSGHHVYVAGLLAREKSARFESTSMHPDRPQISTPSVQLSPDFAPSTSSPCTPPHAAIVTPVVNITPVTTGSPNTALPPSSAASTCSTGLQDVAPPPRPLRFARRSRRADRLSKTGPHDAPVEPAVKIIRTARVFRRGSLVVPDDLSKAEALDQSRHAATENATEKATQNEPAGDVRARESETVPVRVNQRRHVGSPIREQSPSKCRTTRDGVAISASSTERAAGAKMDVNDAKMGQQTEDGEHGRNAMGMMRKNVVALSQTLGDVFADVAVRELEDGALRCIADKVSARVRAGMGDLVRRGVRLGLQEGFSNVVKEELGVAEARLFERMLSERWGSGSVDDDTQT